jgi:hypothetical protein
MAYIFFVVFQYHKVFFIGKLGLSQMVRFLAVEPIHIYLNLKFDMCVTNVQLIILLVVRDISVDIETQLVTDFVNLKIKPIQYFKCAHRSRLYVCVFIEMSTHTYISICVCTVFRTRRKNNTVFIIEL